MIAHIVAMGRGRVIGSAGGIPWHLPGDLKRFKEATMGHPIVMGRKTFESLGRVLPGRTHFVLSRSWKSNHDQVRSYYDIDELMRDATAEACAGEVWVIGGAELYALTLPLTSRIHLTRVDGDFAGDVFYPFDPAESGEWDCTQREAFAADAKNEFGAAVEVYEREAN